MRTVYNKLSPYLFVLFGLLLLFIIGQAIPAGIFLLLGIVMVVERKWPEKWKSNIKE